jgi:hypothetical protein
VLQVRLPLTRSSSCLILNVSAKAAAMGKSHSKLWMTITGASAAVLLVVGVIGVLRLRPPFRVGATMQEVQACVRAEESRRLPPYGRTCGQYGSNTNEWLLGTMFYLRDEHAFVKRGVSLTFSTNGTVVDISSHWEWRWSL